MKRIVETNDGGFDAMLGEKIVLFCGNDCDPKCAACLAREYRR